MELFCYFIIFNVTVVTMAYQYFNLFPKVGLISKHFAQYFCIKNDIADQRYTVNFL